MSREYMEGYNACFEDIARIVLERSCEILENAGYSASVADNIFDELTNMKRKYEWKVGAYQYQCAE